MSFKIIKSDGTFVKTEEIIKILNDRKNQRSEMLSLICEGKTFLGVTTHDLSNEISWLNRVIRYIENNIEVPQ